MSLAWGMIAAGVALTFIGLIGLGVCIVKALAIRRADDPESGGDALRRLAALNMASTRHRLLRARRGDRRADSAVIGTPAAAVRDNRDEERHRFHSPFMITARTQYERTGAAADARCAGRTDEERSEMATGTVKWFNPDKGYGFIQPETGGNDVFVHISAVEAAGLRTLNDNQKISYDMVEDRRGRSSAGNLQLVD